MGAFDNFLKSRGYAKLDRYGLVLTSDDRVLSTRPAVLDDGLGGKIVGWAEGDLAAMELDRYGSGGTPAPAKTLKPPAERVPATVPRQPASMPTVAPMTSAVPMPMPAAAMAKGTPDPFPVTTAPRPSAVATAVSAPQIADAPELTEDEWEWEIAMARVRAVAEDVSVAATAMAFTKPTAPLPRAYNRTAPMAAVAAPKSGSRTMPMAAVGSRSDPMQSWPKTEPLAESWDSPSSRESAPRVMSPIEKKVAVEKRTTMTPVPASPVAAHPSEVRSAVHARTITSAAGRSRMARGTAREDTVQMQPLAQAHTDETSPYIQLPPEVKPTAHAHTTRAAAKYR